MKIECTGPGGIKFVGEAIALNNPQYDSVKAFNEVERKAIHEAMQRWCDTFGIKIKDIKDHGLLTQAITLLDEVIPQLNRFGGFPAIQVDEYIVRKNDLKQRAVREEQADALSV